MFVIGLEFNLPKLRSMRTLVFGLGLSQVVLTMLGAAGRPRACWCGSSRSPARPGSWAGRARWCWAARWRCRSTAIVVKLMAERLELETEHGRRVMGVLLFQDLAVVPLLVLIPALGSSGERHGLGARPGRC